MSKLAEWLFRTIILPSFAAWFAETVKKLEQDASFQAKAKQAVEQYENAKTPEERRAARRALAEL